ncbi:pyrroline-5-carboxylate reductase [Streptomyces sp. CRN 30]|uniref:pyrroline-5-carboxylate reductase n=1 Tax=Streptomyces sp. CRN 30 TaxID=3075613 RepID=UPI002A83BBE4|nr:pyrroline-5-carboxylate reductase [Streptomyces sp. CRN 30]
MNLSAHRVAVIGAGHMGTAMIAGLVASSEGPRPVVVETDGARRAAVLEQFGTVARERYEPGCADTVILAVQPQQFEALARDLAQGAFDGTLVVSVMAGVSIRTMTELLGTARVVRAIPNTPSEIGFGMTVLAPGEAVTPDDVVRAEGVLALLGRVLTVSDEALIDDATALCGGGPAFVAYLAGALCDFAVGAGFDAGQARSMTAQVLRGTAELLDRVDRTPQELCAEVMTPGGTTEQGIFHFRDKGLADIVVKGLDRAARRSRELDGIVR